MGKNCKEAIFTTRPSNPASCHRHARPYPTLPQKASFCHYRATTSLPFHAKPPTVIAMQSHPTVIAVLDTAIFLPTYRVTTNKDTFSAKKDPCKIRGLFYRFNKRWNKLNPTSIQRST
ncbi:MAG TPA: hypothetical protein DCZ76_08285 [Treponema sp.]|nr:hypothetical protein [Treponema sp.]